MEKILIIVGVVLILSFLVFIHELGHFLAARRNGIRVLEFAIGFPPRAFSWKKGDTKYSIGLIPFGGFVKLYGEDASDPKVLKSKKSFASKTPWQKTQVILAGVSMNFLVFWILTSVALMIGVDPLVTDNSQYISNFKNGVYISEPGVVLESGERVFYDEIIEEVQNVSVHPVAMLPGFKIRAIEADSVFGDEFLEGDVLTHLNGVPIFSATDLVEGLSVGSSAEIKFVRDGVMESVNLALDNRFIIDGFTEESPAFEAGILAGDRVLQVDGSDVFIGDSLLPGADSGSVATYVVERGGEVLSFDIERGEGGFVGVILQPEFKLSGLGVDFAATSVSSSITHIEKVREPFYRAPITALSQGATLSFLTAKAFVGTLGDVATRLEVSDEIGGPVQVARLSYFFVERGGVDLMNFIALISLSLAVINILPIPALDGGRFLFIIVEAFRGKPIDAKTEAMIHGIGFMLLMAFIVVVTFYDIVRI